jgi:PfaB family protein
MDKQQQRASTARGCSLAITGLDIRTAACSGLESFERLVYEGMDLFASQLQVESNGKRPAEVRLRQAVEGALADAGFDEGGAVGIIVTSEEKLPPGSTPVLRARPLAAIYGLTGPLEDLDADPVSAFDRAAHMLADGSLRAVLVGWISQEREAAAALVLRRKDDAAIDHEDLYAVIDDAAGTDQTTFERARTLLEETGYLEIAGSISEGNISALTAAYSQMPGMICAFGEDHIPFIPALIKAALCLYQRFIPITRKPFIQGEVDRLKGSSLYVVNESHTWFQPVSAGVRKASVFSEGILFTLSEGRTRGTRRNQALKNSDLHLYPIAGDDLEELIEGLNNLRTTIALSDDLKALAQRTYEDYCQKSDAQYTVAIMGRAHEEALREIEYAIKGVPNAFEKGTDWQTPLGSTFSPVPVGREGSVAFVYPGAFNSYVGMGRELFRLFPHLHERFEEVSSDIGAVICEDLLYPRCQEFLGEDAKAKLEARLNEDPIAMLKSGTTLSTLYTMILQDVFNVKPEAAFGYSLGENSMLFAMGIWTNGDEISQRLSESDLFRTRLSGAQNAVREYWGVVEDRKGALWRNYLVMASPERVYAAIQNESRVYLTHINTPRQVVIGGDPDACQRVIQTLRCAHLQAPFNHALHNEAMRSEQRALVELHSSPVVSISQTQLYSAAAYQPLPIEQQQIAESIGHMLCSSLDFPRLIEQVYASGARFFIELGAGSNCAKWVDETLNGKPHTAIGINRRGVDDLTAIVRVLAKLCAHRLNVDLSPLYFGSADPAFMARINIMADSGYEV